MAPRAAGIKVLVRNLPPGLTKEEFEVACGDEWRIGAGKVDWTDYRHGKIKGPGKAPEQSRAYLHLIAESHLRDFEKHFLSVVFHDAKGTHRHPEVRAPVLEFAPYQRIPPAKSRQDNRQGLIDQDPEYMAFLEGETQAIPKPLSLDAAASADRAAKDVIKSTPLIEALREKKAAKAKSAAAKAAAKRADEPSPQKSKAAKGSKATAEPVKIVTKADSKGKDSVKSNKAPKVADKASSEPIKPKRERAPASIKSILERDLGLTQPGKRAGAGAKASVSSETANAATQTPAKNTRIAKKDKELATVAATSEVGKASTASPVTPKPAKSKAITTKTDSTMSTKSPATEKPATPQSNPRQNKPPQKPSAGAIKAYLKHANASQGVTEEPLRTALSEFGELVTLDIDKRKGTAVAEFKTHEALAAAMAKRSISVGQGAVEVLEFREIGKSKSDKPASRQSQRSAKGRGGKAVTESTPAAAKSPASAPTG